MWKKAFGVHLTMITLSKSWSILFIFHLSLNLIFKLIVHTTFMIYLTKTNATITRLECHLSANFSIKLSGKKHDGNVLATHRQKNFKECAVLCTTTDSCSFFNLNLLTLKCKLISSFHHSFLEDELVNNADWMFGATKFSRKLVRWGVRSQIVSWKCLSVLAYWNWHNFFYNR